MLLNLYLMSSLVFFVCLFSLPWLRRMAVRNRWYDLPGKLKIHDVPIPRLGGAALMGAVAMVTLIGPASWRPPMAVVVAIGAVWLTGLFDDFWAAPILLRFCVQAAAGTAMWSLGWKLSWFDQPLLDLAVTVIFFIFLVNAMNFLDGMDGLALTVSSAVAVGFVILFATASIGSSMWLSCAILAACLGALVHNFPPASIFIGDSGSNLLGALFAFLCLDAIRNLPSGSPKGCVLLFLALPAVDVLAAIVRRCRARVSPFDGDRRHFYDLLLQGGWSTRNILAFSFLVTAVSVTLALLAVRGVVDGSMALAIVVVGCAYGAHRLGSFVPDAQQLASAQTPVGEEV